MSKAEVGEQWGRGRRGTALTQGNREPQDGTWTEGRSWKARREVGHYSKRLKVVQGGRSGGGRRSPFWAHFAGTVRKTGYRTVRGSNSPGSLPGPRQPEATRPSSRGIASWVPRLKRRQSPRARGRCRGNRGRRLGPAVLPQNLASRPRYPGYRDRGRGRPPPQGSFSGRFRCRRPQKIQSIPLTMS